MHLDAQQVVTEFDLPVEPGLTVLPFAVAGISAGAPDFAPALTLLD